MVLLASVAAIGGAAVLAGPGYSPVTIGGTPAHAVESVQPKAGFADLIERVKPAVISVRVKIEQGAIETVGSGNCNSSSFGDNDRMQQFFRQFGMPNMPDCRQGTRKQFITGQGSGFFISADGYAVTNFHVVDHAKTVQIQTDDGKSYTAKVVGIGPENRSCADQGRCRQEIPVRYIRGEGAAGRRLGCRGRQSVRPGSGSATAGIVSARGRDIGASAYDDFIQIDAPINKGNSGGPTFDTDGNVVAVNTAIYSPSGGSVGIGFGIPAETVKTVVAKLKDKGFVDRGWIGVKVQSVTEGIANSLRMDHVEGAIVDEAQADGPAAKAGVQAGDVITAVNGDAVKDSRDLARKIGAIAPDTKITLSALRKGGDQKSFSLMLQPMPGEKQAKADTSEEARRQQRSPSRIVARPGQRGRWCRRQGTCGDRGRSGQRCRRARS